VLAGAHDIANATGDELEDTDLGMYLRWQREWFVGLLVESLEFQEMDREAYA
jgi:hypothetical protein